MYKEHAQKITILYTIGAALPIKLPTIGTALPMKLPTFPATFFAVFQALLNQSEISSFK
jgi:hypothetical protein